MIFSLIEREDVETKMKVEIQIGLMTTVICMKKWFGINGYVNWNRTIIGINEENIASIHGHIVKRKYLCGISIALGDFTD